MTRKTPAKTRTASRFSLQHSIGKQLTTLWKQTGGFNECLNELAVYSLAGFFKRGRNADIWVLCTSHDTISLEPLHNEKRKLHCSLKSSRTQLKLAQTLAKCYTSGTFSTDRCKLHFFFLCNSKLATTTHSDTYVSDFKTSEMHELICQKVQFLSNVCKLQKSGRLEDHKLRAHCLGHLSGNSSFTEMLSNHYPCALSDLTPSWVKY